MTLLDIIVGFYINSGDFNGIPLSRLLEETGLSLDQLKTQLALLVRDGFTSINFGDRHPNAHIKAFPPEPSEEQIAKLADLNGECEEPESPDSEPLIFHDTEGNPININFAYGSLLHHVCVYPERPSLDGKIDLTPYAGKPFDLRLALGEPQLAFENFDLSVLEIYRNDPRYHYSTNDIGGTLCIRDEHYLSDDCPDSEKALLEHFGFSYNERLGRAVAGFLRDLSRLTPEHQRIWEAKIVKGEYILHPDYARSVAGEWPEKLSIFEAFLMELEAINGMCERMGKPHLFRDAPGSETRPREFAFLLRPTVKEFQGFVSLLDKLLSESLNKEFFKGDLELTEEIPRGEGKVELRHKGTIALLGEWVSKKVRLSDAKPFDEALATIREVRNLRQRPAHALDDNKFDPEIFKEQRSLIIRAYSAVRVLRLLFANHPLAKSQPILDELRRGDIWTF